LQKLGGSNAKPGRDEYIICIVRPRGSSVESFEKVRLEARLESLCEKGCRYVWKDIDALERGEELKETRDLSPAERRWLLAELKLIMSVYSERCSVD
jgi:hypothetical protein